VESNWRWNVYKSGWAYSDVGLLARYSGPGLPPNIYLSNWLTMLGWQGFVWPPGAPMAILGYWWTSTGPPHFPYGIPVDPD